MRSRAGGACSLSLFVRPQSHCETNRRIATFSPTGRDMSPDPSPVTALLQTRAAIVTDIYTRLSSSLRQFGPLDEDPKKTSIHLSHGSAFAGVHPRASTILLNIRTSEAIDSPRIRKTEQVSKNRFHNETLLTSPDDVDSELLTWLERAYRLA